MRAPRRLWSEGWRFDSEQARAEAAERRSARPAEAPAAPQEATAELPGRPPERAAEAAGPPRERRARTPSRRLHVVSIVAAGAAALAVAGFAVGSLTAGDDEPARSTPLSAAPAPAPSFPTPRTSAGTIYEQASPAVVSINAGGGSGTGFLVDGDGTLVTNAHVVGSARRVTVKFGARGKRIRGRVVGKDPSIDIAVVGIEPSSVPSDARPLQFADSSSVRVGDRAIAIGSPFGLDRTATEGIVSALDREIEAPNGFQIDGVIQTDAPINPGNSGGPLLTDGGSVIGVNAQIATGGSRGNVGVGFAIAANDVRAALPRLRAGKAVERAWLGVETSGTAAGDGATVENVVDGSPAERAGLREGDRIVAAGGDTVVEPADVGTAVNARKPGQTIDIVVERDGSRRTIPVELGVRPERVP